MEEKVPEVTFTEEELRVVRQRSLFATLLGFGLLGYHIADAKVPSTEFFSNMSGWRQSSNPIAAIAGLAGFLLAFFAPMLLGLSLTPARFTGKRGIVRELSLVACWIAGLGLLITMTTSPSWFSAILAATCLPLAAGMLAAPSVRARLLKS